LNIIATQASAAITTVLSVVIVFGTLIFVHELGHFTAAKLAGVHIFDFAMGYGPVIWQKKWRGTRYSLRGIPLGGFVRMAGMDENPEGETEPIPAHAMFDKKPLWKRLMIIVAGPVANLALAFIVIACYLMIVSIPPTIQSVTPNSPAAIAGMQPGDQFVSVANVEVDNVNEVVELIQAHINKDLLMQMRRDKELVNLTVTPQYDPTADAAMVGITLFDQQRQPLLRSLRIAYLEMGRWTVTILSYVGDMITGRMKADISGPVGIVVITGSAAQEGLASLMRLVVLLNINLGLFNLFPIPLLDGFWLVLFVYEAIRRRPLEPQQRANAQAVGLAILVLLLVFATYQDLARFFPGA
jgi:regulator of sigma E protease